jgi:Aerotolerance regulator N-terminal/von Willebrand factor type A domain
MSFLAPLFLFGALAVGLPVIFHLIRHTTRERTWFSSLMFLAPTPPRLTRRSRLEHLLLLALRCLVLCLLALGFARPFLKHAAGNVADPAAARRMLVLVDTSASMRRANLWSEARSRADAILNQTSPADQVAVLAFDRQVRPLFTFGQWNAAAIGERVPLAVQALADTSPGWSSTQLGNALIAAAEMLADTGDRPSGRAQQIVLISDLQAGSRLESLQGYEWPKGIGLSVEILKPRHPGNAGLQLVGGTDDVGPKPDAQVRVRVNNDAGSTREQFEVGWARPDGRAFADKPAEVYVPPGQSRIVTLPAPSTQGAAFSSPGEQLTPAAATSPGLHAPGGSSVSAPGAGLTPPSPYGVADRIILRGDDEDFDNTVYAVPPEITRLSVLYLGGDSGKDPRQPLYFLERAFQDTRRQEVQIVARAPGAPVPPAEPDDATLIIVTDPLPGEQARALRARVAAGKTLLFMLKSDAAAATLANLLGVGRVDLEEAHPENYAMLAQVDFRHPLFSVFADPRFSDFTSIHFWKYRRLDAAAIPGARAVAKFDSGDPAVVEVPVEKGRVLVLTSGWQPDDSQLALSTKFVPLLYSLLEASGAPAPLPLQYRVGDVVPLGEMAGDSPAAWTIRAPDGSQLNLSRGETNFTATLMPGIYHITSASPAKEFAVNLDAAESRTAPLPADELERLGAPVLRQVPVAAREAERKVRLRNSELENRQKLWRWFIVATLAVLLVETWLAGRTARRMAIEGGATS